MKNRTRWLFSEIVCFLPIWRQWSNFDYWLITNLLQMGCNHKINRHLALIRKVAICRKTSKNYLGQWWCEVISDNFSPKKWNCESNSSKMVSFQGNPGWWNLFYDWCQSLPISTLRSHGVFPSHGVFLHNTPRFWIFYTLKMGEMIQFDLDLFFFERGQ